VHGRRGDEGLRTNSNEGCRPGAARIEDNGMNSILRTCVLLASIVLAVGARADEWVPVKDVSLLVTPGSLLDFSSFAGAAPAGNLGRVVAGEGGRLAFEKAPGKPQRFFAASLALSPPNGGFPTPERADVFARQLRLHGYNLLRIFQVDATLMAGRTIDFDFNPEQWDRFQYFLAALKKEGIYWIIDAVTSDNGAYGGDLPNRWANKHDLKVGVYFDPARQAHWRRLVTEILSRTNKYTGMRPIDDPALAGIILVNEGGIHFHAAVGRRGFPAGLESRFANWLKERYGEDSAVRSAWGRDWADGASLADGRVGLPKAYDEQSKRGNDFARFVADLERRTTAWMTAHLRELGYRGLVTNLNNWAFFQADVARADLEWIDMHSYHTEPTRYVDPGSEIKQTSSVDDTLFYYRQLAAARQGGKPFTVTEYGQPFWNSWRREAGLVMGAYGSLQGWDMICQFGENTIEMSYAPDAVQRKRAIYPFGIALDPVARAGETLAALLYMRGDVRIARASIALSLSHDDAMSRESGTGMMPPELSRLALVSAIGLDLRREARRSSAVLPWARKSFEVGAGQGSGYLERARRVLGERIGRMDARAGQLLEDLKAEGIIPSSNRSDPAAGIFQSDTEEILLEVPQRRLRVVTRLTEAVSFGTPGEVILGKSKILGGDVPALVSVSSMDGRALDSSQRMLVIFATDAINTGMTFADTDRTKLLALGTVPPQIRPGKVSIELESVHAASVRAYALDLTGKRGAELSIERLARSVRITLDNRQGPQGPTTYFELAVGK